MSAKPQVRKALFIGLGGTGAKTLIALKKRFYEVYGHIDDDKGSMPEFVKFMVFDTDAPGTLGESKLEARNATSGKVTQVRFEPAEVISMEAPNCGKFILSQENREIFKGWMPMNNSRVLSTLNDLDEGAGQIRMFGRVAYFFNADRMRTTLEKAVNEVLRAGRAQEHFDPLKGGAIIDVHIVASLAGGTGSGMFMDTAMVLREILDTKGAMEDAEINGYFVLPSVFIDKYGEDKMPRVLPNACGALKELDFFMEFKTVQESRSLNSTMSDVWDPVKGSPLHEAEVQGDEVVVEYMGGESTCMTSKPYSNVFLIDSVNSEGDTYKDVEDLAECVAKGLFANVTSISTKLKSQDDNNKDLYTTFRHKKGWAGSLGVSELVYNLPEVRKHLALRALEEGLGQLMAPCEDMTAKAFEMLCDLGLVEKDERSDLVTALSRAVPVKRKDLYEDMDASTERTVASGDVAKLFPAVKLEANGILARAKEALTSLNSKLPGVGQAAARVALLKALQRHATLSREEVKKDEEQLKLKLGAAERDLFGGTDSTEKLLKGLEDAGILKKLLRKSEIEELRNEWMEGMYKVMQLSMTAECMRQAKFILEGLESECNTAIEALTLANGKLDSLRGKVSETLGTRRYSGIAKEFPTPFVIHLHVADMEREFKPLESAQWSQSVFMKDMDELLKDSAEGDLDAACAWVVGADGRGGREMKELQDLIEEPGSSKMNMWLSKMVEEARGTNDITSTRLGQVMQDLMERSAPLFGIDGQGVSSDAENATDRKMVEDCMRDVYMVCVPSKGVQTSMEEVLKPLADDRIDIEYAAVPDQKDRVTIFRRQTGAPVFALTRTRTYERAYKNRHKHWETNGEVFHTNYNWFRAMEQVGFSLQQGASVSGEHALEMWAKAFLCGYIQWNEGSRYWEVASKDPSLRVQKDKDRIELFCTLMQDHDFGSEVEEKLRIRTQQEGLNFMSSLVQANVEMDATQTVTASKYLSSPLVNPYHKTITPTDPWGSAYGQLNQGKSLELLQEEEKYLLQLFAKVSQGGFGF